VEVLITRDWPSEAYWQGFKRWVKTADKIGEIEIFLGKARTK
jgi:hypothetical protein